MAFKAFPADRQMFVPQGAVYLCAGCGKPVPDGAWARAEDVEIAKGKVIGIRATAGESGPVVHSCGSMAD